VGWIRHATSASCFVVVFILFYFKPNVLLLLFIFFFLDVFQSLISRGCSNKYHLSYLSSMPIGLLFITQCSPV